MSRTCHMYMHMHNMYMYTCTCTCACMCMCVRVRVGGRKVARGKVGCRAMGGTYAE